MSPRYRVQKARFEDKEGIYYRHIILDGPFPDYIINKIFKLSTRLEHKKRENTTIQYRWVDFANWLWDIYRIEYKTASLLPIINYFEYLREGKDISADSIKTYVMIVAKAYDGLELLGFKLDDSLYKGTPEMALTSSSKVRKNGAEIKIRKIVSLYGRRRYMSAQMKSYTKWYTPEEIEKIACNLRLDYACVFLISVYAGYRISSILSITLFGFNPVERTIVPTHSKTNILNVAKIPQFLTNMIENYIDELRPADSLSEYLFLNKKGEPMRYAAYREALVRAGKKAGIKDGVHTHAGRSTFLAHLRNLQMENNPEVAPPTDAEICYLMGWKSLSCLENYDRTTRVIDLDAWDLDYDEVEAAIVKNFEEKDAEQNHAGN